MFSQRWRELDRIDDRIDKLSQQYEAARRMEDIQKSQFLTMRLHLARRERGLLLQRLGAAALVSAGQSPDLHRGY